MAGLTFNGTSGKLEFSASPSLDLSTGANTICWMAQTTALNTAWQCPVSGETSAHSSRWSIERAIGTGTGGAGNPVNDSVTYQKATAADAVWTGETSVGPPATDANALKWVLADGLMMGWVVKPAAGSSRPFCKIFTGSGSTWTEKSLSPQDMTFQIGDGTALGVGGLIVVGAFESSDWFKGDIHLVGGNPAALTSAAINTLMTTKTTAAIIAAFGASAFLTDASNALATDLIGGRSRTVNTGTSAASAVSSSLWTFGTGGGGGTTVKQLSALGVG